MSLDHVPAKEFNVCVTYTLKDQSPTSKVVSIKISEWTLHEHGLYPAFINEAMGVVSRSLGWNTSDIIEFRVQLLEPT